MTLILEIAAGVVLGILTCIALFFFAVAIRLWYKEQRWWWGYKKHERMVQRLSRRYSQHLLKEGERNESWGEDELEKFDSKAMARIRELGRRVDAMRDAL